MNSTRLGLLSRWLTEQLRLPVKTIQPLAGDASFRNYYRIIVPNNSYIAMDAPPQKVDCRPFIAIAQQLQKADVKVPHIVEENLDQGFLLLEDMGDTLLFSALNNATVDKLYRQALQILLRLQHVKQIAHHLLPQFDAQLMQQEMQLFVDWFLKGKLGLTLNASEQTLIQDAFIILSDKIAKQPYMCVHRDYHSRNLMVLKNGDLGVLDFQDAVWGPITYDVISLLKDCYIVWPRDKVIDLAGYYHQLASSADMTHQTLSEFLEDFEWMGIQRHLKVIGIFCRLDLRDHKPGYLKDIPVAMRYLMDALDQFGELAHFKTLLRTRVLPIYQNVWSLANV